MLYLYINTVLIGWFVLYVPSIWFNFINKNPPPLGAWPTDARSRLSRRAPALREPSSAQLRVCEVLLRAPAVTPRLLPHTWIYPLREETDRRLLLPLLPASSAPSAGETLQHESERLNQHRAFFLFFFFFFFIYLFAAASFMDVRGSEWPPVIPVDTAEDGDSDGEGVQRAGGPLPDRHRRHEGNTINTMIIRSDQIQISVRAPGREGPRCASCCIRAGNRHFLLVSGVISVNLVIIKEGGEKGGGGDEGGGGEGGGDEGGGGEGGGGGCVQALLPAASSK